MKRTIKELWTMVRHAIACVIALVAAVFDILAYTFVLISMVFAKIGQLPHRISVMLIHAANKVALGSTNRMTFGKFGKRKKD